MFPRLSPTQTLPGTSSPSHSSCWGSITTIWPSSTALSSSSTVCMGCSSCASEDLSGWELQPSVHLTYVPKNYLVCDSLKTFVPWRFKNACLSITCPHSVLHNFLCEHFVASFRHWPRYCRSPFDKQTQIWRAAPSCKRARVIAVKVKKYDLFILFPVHSEW